MAAPCASVLSFQKLPCSCPGFSWAFLGAPWSSLASSGVSQARVSPGLSKAALLGSPGATLLHLGSRRQVSWAFLGCIGPQAPPGLLRVVLGSPMRSKLS